ncbi:kinesin-like protein KIF15-A isoform X4 [Tachysurus ichikawai]
MQAKVQGLREASDRVELELLQEDLAFVTEEVEKLNNVLEEKTSELQSVKRLCTERDMSISAPCLTLHVASTPICLKCWGIKRRSWRVQRLRSVLRDVHEERRLNSTLMTQLAEAQKRLQHQEVTLIQSQACIQELTTELRNRCLEEVEVMRKQVDHLAEENGKLLGHQNHKQKAEYLVRLKKELTKLQKRAKRIVKQLIWSHNCFNLPMVLRSPQHKH